MCLTGDGKARVQRGLPAGANRGGERYIGPRGAEDQEINIKDIELGPVQAQTQSWMRCMFPN